jgi:hypothetical protein
VARIMVGQPFDTIKTRLQVLGKGTIGAAGMPPEMVYNSGKSLPSADAGSAPSALPITAYVVPSSVLLLYFVCCLAWHAASTSASVPASLHGSRILFTQMFQCLHLSFAGLDCVRKMMKSEGPFSLYKGTIAPLLGNMVLLGIHFPTFMKTRAYLEQGDAPGAFTPWKILAAGAAAGAAGSVVSTPTELIRTKMQMVRKNNILAQMKGAAAGGINPEENYKVRCCVCLWMQCAGTWCSVLCICACRNSTATVATVPIAC